MHLIRVDLPAPLSPASASTSPACSRKETCCSAWTPPKRFERPRASSSGPAPGCSCFILDLALEAAPRLVDQDRDDDHHADRDELPERLDVDEHEAVLDYR